MSETNIEQNPQQSAPPQEAITLNTKLEFLNQKFYFHDILKESGVNKHYIAEDLEYDSSTNASGGFFYVKQSLFSHKGEYNYALKYYQRLLNYCKMPFAKTDIIRLHHIHNFDLEEEGYFELVLIFDLGEPDRIDIDNIESQHITKFLKNVCLLLQDLKKFDQIYHGNIYIKNIVLVNTELKLSGFKPIYLENPEYQTWKVQLAKQYNHFRSDLYLIGLIWLRFLGARVEEVTSLQLGLEEVVGNVNHVLGLLPEEKRVNIVMRLLDLENHPDLTLDDVILEFDEFYILENIRSVEQEKKRLAETGALETDSNHNPAFSLEDARRNSAEDRFESLGGRMKKSDSKDTNPFMRPYKESERDIQAIKGLDINEHHASESRQNPDYLKIDGDFTLQDDDDSIMPQRLSKDELITIQDVKKEHSKSLFEKMNDDVKKYDSTALGNKINSEKKFNPSDSLEDEKSSMRKLKSTEGLFTDSKKEIDDADQRTPHKHSAPERVQNAPRQSFKKKFSHAQVTEERKPSQEKTSPKNSVAKPAKKSEPKPAAKDSSPKKPSVKVSQPAEPKLVEQKQKPKPKTISTFSKKVKKNRPPVQYVEEQPSASQVLREKRAQLQGVKTEVELTSEQKVKIQKAVEKELGRRTQAEAERQASQKEELEQRAYEHKMQESRVKEKLGRISKEKLLKKHEQLREELKKRREGLEQHDHETYQNYLKDLEKKERMQKNRDVSAEKKKEPLHGTLHSALQATHKDVAVVPSKAETQTLPIKTAEKSLFDLVNTRAQKEFQMSNANARENLFSYNRELVVVKQVPFKKVTTNPDKYQKSDVKKPNSTLDNLFKTLDLGKPSDEHPTEQIGKGSQSPEKNKKAMTADLGNNNQNKKPVKVAAQTPDEGRNEAPSFGASQHETGRNASQEKHNAYARSDSIDKKSATGLHSSDHKDTHETTKSPKQSSATKHGPFGSLDRSSVNKDHPDKNAFLDALLSNPNLKNLDPALLEGKIFAKTMDEAKSLVNANQTEEAISLLLSAKEKFTNNRRVDATKMAAALYQKIGQTDKTKKLLLEALEYMLANNNIEGREDIFRSIIINLVLIAIEMQDYQEAVALLKNQAFNDQSKLPNNYYSLLGDCYLHLGKHKEALDAFEQQLTLWLGQQASFETIAPLFNLINKTMLANNALNDQVAIAKFFSKMVGVFKNIKHVNKSLLLHENDFDNLLEHLVLNVLAFACDRRNYNLMNYVMNEAIGKNLLNVVDNMNEEERIQLCEYFTHFCDYLKKLPSYGGFKANYIKYLDYGKSIIKNCDLNTKNLKTNLMILFNRGIFYLQEQNHAKAEKIFDKCLEVYYAFFNEPDKDLYAILYDIGLNLYHQKKFGQAVYYFSKMLDLNCQDLLLKEKATKYLGKVYYRLEEYDKCRSALEPFIERHFEGKSVINFYKYLSIYYLCLNKQKSDDFNAYLQRLHSELSESPKAEGVSYLTVYQALNNIMKNHHNYKENERYLGMLQDLVAEKSTDKRAKSAKLVNLISFIHQKYISERTEEKGTLNASLIQALRDRWMTVEENSEMGKDFLLSFLFMLLNRLPLYNERIKNHQFRQKAFDDIRSAVDKKAINEYLMDLFNGLSSSNDDEAMGRTLARLQPGQPKGQHNVFAANEPEREMQKITSEQVLLKSAPARADCFCSEAFKENIEISRLIESFLKQIKNMLFLDVNENVLAYYKRFEAALIEKGISAEKYSYIKRLIEYHLLRKNYQKLDRLKFTRMLDELVERGSLCVHDWKLILIILESFKEIEYLQILVIYLDTYHPNLAALVFQQVFLEVFQHKYAKIVAALSKKINNFRFHQLENFALMHYLESQNFINIEKELAFQIYTRLRFDLLHEERLFRVFSKYLNPNDLHMFYLKYNVYAGIVSAVKGEGLSGQTIMWNLFNNLSSDILKHQIEEIHARHFAYELLTLVHLLKFQANQDITEPIFKTLAFIEDRLPQFLYYHFSIVCSAIGNIFFKHKLVSAALKAKLSAMDLLNKASDADVEPPKYVIREDAESHLSQILSFIVVAQIELEHVDQARQFLEKYDALKTEYAVNELTKLLVKSMYLYHAGDIKKSSKTVKTAQELLERMNLKDIQQDMYTATIDKIRLLIAIKKDKKEEVANRVRQSEGSIAHLYRPLV